MDDGGTAFCGAILEDFNATYMPGLKGINTLNSPTWGWLSTLMKSKSLMVGAMTIIDCLC